MRVLRPRGWIYTASFYTQQDLSGRICPWCIADGGGGAERFNGEFADAYSLDGVSWEVLQEVTRRTPSFHACQDPRWLVHCQARASQDTPAARTRRCAGPDARAVVGGPGAAGQKA